MSRPNALRRAGLQSQLARGYQPDPFKVGFSRLRKFAAVVGEGSNPAVVAAAKELRKGIQKVLNVRGGVSKPGEAPHRQSGRLRKSVRYAVTGGAMRVGTNYFTADWLQDGLDAETRKGHTRKRRGKDGKIIARHRVRATGHIRIEPRPFMEAGLRLAQSKMTGAMVTILRRTGPGA